MPNQVVSLLFVCIEHEITFIFFPSAILISEHDSTITISRNGEVIKSYNV